MPPCHRLVRPCRQGSTGLTAILGLWLGCLASGSALAQAAAAQPSPVETTLPREADGLVTLHQSLVVAAPASRVWAALSTSEGWRQWAAPFALVDFRLGGVIESSYQRDARPGAPENIRNQIVAYLPQRLLAIRNVQAPPTAAFDVPTFQSLHTVVLLDPLDAGRTRVTIAQPGFRSDAPHDSLLAHFRRGNDWTLAQLKRSLERAPGDAPADTR
jgi:uncharacterized protein YndB with AHSA1/START domain